MKIAFQVKGVPPKKDGANSMWRKGSELAHLKALRVAAHQAMGDTLPTRDRLSMTVCVFAAPQKGDLDNFITGICDGLMAVHPNTPIDLALWQDVPSRAQPHNSICFFDDAQIYRITAERLPLTAAGERYTVELEW